MPDALSSAPFRIASLAFGSSRELDAAAEVIEVRADDYVLVPRARDRSPVSIATTFCVFIPVVSPVCAAAAERATNFWRYPGTAGSSRRYAYRRAMYAAAESLPGVPVSLPSSAVAREVRDVASDR